jgi:hypothetical protein
MSLVQSMLSAMTTLIATMTVGADRPRGEVQARTTVRNLESLPRFQRLCERFGIRPTYLLTYPILQHGRADWFRRTLERGACEVGMSLEPWTTPPFDANEDRLTAHSPNAIPPNAVVRKVATLAQSFEVVMGIPPKAHRAAGYGLCAATLQALEIHGVIVDSSVTPLLNSRPAGSVDWRFAPATPYHPDRQKPALRGSSPVLEVPLAVGFDRNLPNPVATAVQRAADWLPVDTLLSNRWYSVCGMTALAPGSFLLEDMQRLVDVQIAKGIPQLVLELTSEALHQGESATSMTTQEVTRTFESIDSIFRYVVDRHHRPSAGLITFARQYVRPGVKRLSP